MSACQVSAYLLLNIDGVYVGDRTSADGPIFLPTANNTQRIPQLSELNSTQKEGDWAWAAYSGAVGFFRVLGLNPKSRGRRTQVRPPLPPPLVL